MTQKNNDLTEAVRIGDLENLRNLINRYDLNYSKPWADGYNLLLSSTQLKHTEITKLLLNSGSKVNDQHSKPADTPLHFSVENGDFEIVEMLLNQGANINAKNESGSTPLLSAILKGNEEIAELLLTRKAHPCGNKDGITPLQVAIEKGLSNLIGKLSNVEAKAISISSPNKLNNTEIEKPLLKRKSQQISLKSKEKRATTLPAAVADGDLELVKLLLRRGANFNKTGSYPLLTAIRNKHVEIAEFLLNRGANICGNYKGVTPLHIAAEKGLPTVAAKLLKLGAGINSACNSDYIDRDGFTALHFAILHRKEEVAILLLNHGADVHANCSENLTRADIEGDITPLHIAAEKGLTNIVEKLLKLGANVNSTSRDGLTPLHFAVANKRNKATELLLNFGANVDVKCRCLITPYQLKKSYNIKIRANHSNVGITPLHIAVKKDVSNIIEHLLKFGADINSASKDGFTPLHFAIADENEDITVLLLNHGADVDAKARCLSDALQITNEEEDVHTKEGEYDFFNDDFLYYVSPKTLEEFTPLHFGARYNDVESIKLLLNKNAVVDPFDKNGKTPLYIALLCGNIEAAKFLIDHGANIDAEDQNGKTILNSAVTKGYLLLVQNILKHFRPDIDNESNKESLNIAFRDCDKNNKKVFESLLEYGFTIKPEDINDSTLVYNVIRNGYSKQVEDLLEYGLDLRRNIEHYLPLHIAVKNQQIVVAESLLTHGADVNAKDEAGNPPIFYSTENSDINMTNLLLLNGATIKDHSYELLTLAIENDFIKMVEIILENQIDINATDKDGITALHSTALNKLDCDPDVDAKVEMARLLLNYGAYVNAKTKNDVTTLHLACKNNFIDLVEILLEYKADVECLIDKTKFPSEFDSHFGQTALHIVAREGYADIIPILLKGGANINCIDCQGNTPLHVAATYKHSKVVSELLKHGVLIDAKNEDGRKALHISCEDDDIKIVQILLRGGANTEGKDNKGCTPIHIAGKARNVCTIAELLKHGAFVDSKDNDCRTVLQNCCENGYFEILTLLLEFGADVNIMTEDNETLIDLATDEFYDPGDESDDEEAFEIIKLHLIKLKAANFYINEENHDSIDILDDDILKSHQAECEEEVNMLKKEKITTKVSFYDVLTKDLSSLVKYARNEDILHNIESNNYKSKFPIYANMIERNFKKGFQRNVLLEQSDHFFERYFEIPYGCTDQIKSYLSNADLKTIIDL